MQHPNPSVSVHWVQHLHTNDFAEMYSTGLYGHINCFVRWYILSWHALVVTFVLCIYHTNNTGWYFEGKHFMCLLTSSSSRLRSQNHWFGIIVLTVYIYCITACTWPTPASKPLYLFWPSSHQTCVSGCVNI